MSLRIAVVLGSTRPGRRGEAVARWLLEQAASRAATYELVDLRDHPLPHLDEPEMAAVGPYAHEHTRSWARTIAPYDGFVFVTPEYNHSISAALKTAIDCLYAEWNNKAAACVSYGSVGGARAIEHLRGVASALQIAHVRQQLSFSLVHDWERLETFRPGPHHGPAAERLFAELEAWAAALRPLRRGSIERVPA